MDTHGIPGTKVTMKLTCGPITEHQDGIKSYKHQKSDGSFEERSYINKNIVLNAQYGKPEDNTFATATPSGKLEFSLQNPGADIFKPGKQYRITLEEWID